MGVLFTLDRDTKAITQQALDDIITELAKNCLLLYPPKKEPCGCNSNYLINGSKAPLSVRCHLCGGTGYREVQTTEVISMVIQSDPAFFWIKAPKGVDIPSGTIQAKCYAEDVVKIRQAKEMQLQPELNNLVKLHYKLAGDPIDISSIIQGRYFVSLWERIQ